MTPRLLLRPRAGGGGGDQHHRESPSRLPASRAAGGHSRKVKLAGPAASRHGGRSRTSRLLH